MTSIHILMEIISDKQLRRNYLKTKKYFLICVGIFEIYFKIWTFSKKRCSL